MCREGGAKSHRQRKVPALPALFYAWEEGKGMEAAVSPPALPPLLFLQVVPKATASPKNAKIKVDEAKPWEARGRAGKKGPSEG